jgi:hypothetical protein
MALPKHKTCISILRSILGPGAGGEARFAEKIGRSTSWLKKASCGQIPLTRDAAIAIAYETGASKEWLYAGDATKPPVDMDGNPYTLETYANHRARDRENQNWEESEDIMSVGEALLGFHSLLCCLKAANKQNRGGLFTFYLTEFWADMEEKFGLADVKDDLPAETFADVFTSMVVEWDRAGGHSYEGWLHPDPASKPQKKQPSRKSKRLA